MIKLLLGVMIAIAVTAALDANGLVMFSALSLIPLFAAFAWLDRLSRAEVGLTLGQASDYAIALAHPIVAIGALGVIASLAGATDFSAFDPIKTAANVAVLTVVTFVVAIFTEEGFFRGWLWGGAKRRGASPLATLAVTTAAFVAWHIPFVWLSGEFHFGAPEIPVFFVNATLVGLVWGLLRLQSGSILVSSAGHGLWNGLCYVLFGIGTGTGALGISDVGLYGPEVGWLGVALNAASVAFFGWRFRNKLFPGPVLSGEPAQANNTSPA